MSETKFFHSVYLDESKCKGCVQCLKRCPTQAIRVRNGKAHINSERCIDCGECIRICPYHAKCAEKYSFNEILEYKYRVALPAPSLYGQFNNLDDTDYVLTGLKRLGFDDVFEVSKGAELVSEATRLILSMNKTKMPVISSACPAVVRLIRVRFPSLIDNVLDLNAPMEEAARLARIKAREDTGLPDEDIGVFFISPCTAKISSIKQPLCNEKSNINGVFGIKDIYPVLFQQMDKIEKLENLSESGIIGVGWASSGGESSALLKDRYLAADGIESVIKVLGELEDEKLNDLEFIELNACSGGCVGGPLTVENPYVAKARLHRLRKYMPVSCNHLEYETVPKEMHWQKPLEAAPWKLADNVSEAMAKMSEIKQLMTVLPGLDCGMCGSPSCQAFAEDTVRGHADINDCIFFLKDKEGAKNFIPAPFRGSDDTK
ncbi:MAG: 4Fe-4S dicluster domain-containing protein [Oscillospiraceae bacterium]|nr:4Fe-4S dicluster domain-containing protein [Oscillospiraceae bacterium]